MNAMDAAAKREAFRAMHAAGCFLLPNPWDAGTATYLAAQGFRALATTSSGAAHARGQADGAMDLEDTVMHAAEIASATDLPVNVDFGHGFGADAEGVGHAVGACLATGVAAVSIEDATGDAARPLFPLEEAVARAVEALKEGRFEVLGTRIAGGMLNGMFGG